MRAGITENKETDRLILLNIEDEKEFLNLCITDTYFKNLCDENMYRRRLEKYYPAILKAKPKLKTYKKWYLKNMKAKGKLKEKYNFEYKTGVPTFYLDILLRREYERGEDYYIESIIIRAGKLGYIDVIDYIRNILKKEVKDSDVLTNFAGSVSLENLKILLSLNVNQTDIQFAILNTMKRGNYDNFSYMVNTYGLNPDFENESPDFEVGESAASGMNEKIMDYLLDKFPRTGVISGVLSRLIHLGAKPLLINKYYEILLSKGDYLSLIESTADDMYLFKKSVDEYMKNPNPDVDSLKDILGGLLLKGKEERAKYLLEMGLELGDSLIFLDDFVEGVKTITPYAKNRIKNTAEMY